MKKKICPKCKSENIIWKDNNIYGSPGIWICKECSFHAPIFPEKILNKVKRGDK